MNFVLIVCPLTVRDRSRKEGAEQHTLPLISLKIEIESEREKSGYFTSII